MRPLRGIVPGAVGVIPKQQVHTFALGIFRQLLNAVTTYLRIPKGIHEGVFITHLRCQVDHLHLILVDGRVVLPDEPAPGVAAWAIVSLGFIERLHHIVGDGGLNDRFQRSTDGNGAPGSRTRQIDACIVATHALHLTRVGESDGITLALLKIAQVGTNIVTAYTRLTDKHPTIFTDTEETREGITFTECRRRVDGSVGGIFFLIGRLGLGKTYHRFALRTDEAGGLIGEVETGSLALDDDTDHRHIIGIGQGDIQLVGDKV